MITHAVDRFVNISSDVEDPSKSHQNDQDRNLEIVKGVAPFKKFNSDGNIPYDSARNVKRLPPTATKSFMNSCFNNFIKEAVSSGVGVES